MSIVTIMRSLLLPALCVLTCLAAALPLASCASKGGSGDGGYTPPPTLSPVDATTRLQDQYRKW